jgi:hypothetical protein
MKAKLVTKKATVTKARGTKEKSKSKLVVTKKKRVTKKEIVEPEEEEEKEEEIEEEEEEKEEEIEEEEEKVEDDIDDTPEHLASKSKIKSKSITPKKNKVSPDASRNTNADILNADTHPDASKYNDEVFIKSTLAIGIDLINANDAFTAVEVAEELIGRANSVTKGDEKMLFLIDTLSALAGSRHSAELRINDCFGRVLLELASLLDDHSIYKTQIIRETFQQVHYRLTTILYESRGFHNEGSAMAEISLGLNELQQFESVIKMLGEKMN